MSISIPNDPSELDSNQIFQLSFQEASSALRVLGVGATLVPETFDYISLSYTGSNLTGVVYKTGGASGTTVGTLTLAYSGSNLISVTRT